MPEPVYGPGGTKYTRDCDDRAFRFCLLGATTPKLALVFEVSDSTIENWMRDHPSFKRAVLRGREDADATVAQSLFHRANGYTKTIRRTESGTNAQGAYDKEVVAEVDYPPDAGAAKFWLAVRQKWRDSDAPDPNAPLKIQIVGGLPDPDPEPAAETPPPAPPDAVEDRSEEEQTARGEDTES